MIVHSKMSSTQHQQGHNIPCYKPREVHNRQKLWLATADVSHFDVSFVYAAFHEAPYDVWTMLLVDDIIKNRTT